jgi:signal transduction histidine kinase
VRAMHKSMFGRMAAAYVIIMLLLSFVIVRIALRAQGDYALEADQKMHVGLAANLAQEFSPFLQGMPDYPRVEETIHNLMIYNPRIEIYVLDTTGTVLSFFSDPEKVVRKRVSVGPLKELMAGAELPLMGDDPRASVGQKPFSVAPIDLGNRQGYLYVILGGELVDTSLAAAKMTHISGLFVRTMAMVFLASILIGIALFAGYATRFRRLRNVVRRFGEGDHSARAQISGGDEISELSQAFDQMAETLESALGELRQRDKNRREQVANISHDLKTPLSSILGYVETIQMRESELSVEERNRYLGVIRENAKTLNRMISELGDLARLESPTTQPTIESFYLEELVQDATLAFAPLATKAGISLSTRLTGANPQVAGDVGLLERVLANLVRNAIQYTDSGGDVIVEVQQQEDHFRVLVHDTGCGIAAEEIPRVTSRFYRVDKSRTSGTAGLGLGLAISEMILNLHGSRLEIESEPRQGSTMSFSLSA